YNYFPYRSNVTTHQDMCHDIEGSMLSFKVFLGVCRNILRLCRDIEATSIELIRLRMIYWALTKYVSSPIGLIRPL
ncbi:hypothetical protein J1N35_044295, partial [Gossypium stocksii]